MKQIFLTGLWYILSISAVIAADIPLEFETPAQEQRYQEIIEELRCLVCQNQNLADSHADLAQDLREEVHRMIIAGNSNDEIKSFMVARYGNFVLYRPPVRIDTWLLWFGPFILLFLALVMVIRFVKARSIYPEPQLDEQQQARLDKLIQGESKE